MSELQDGYFVAYGIDGAHDYRESNEKMTVSEYGKEIDAKIALIEHPERRSIMHYMLEVSAEDMRKNDLYLAFMNTYKDLDVNKTHLDRSLREVILLTDIDPNHPVMDLNAEELGYAIQEKYELMDLTKEDILSISEKVQEFHEEIQEEHEDMEITK